MMNRTAILFASAVSVGLPASDRKSKDRCVIFVEDRPDKAMAALTIDKRLTFDFAAWFWAPIEKNVRKPGAAKFSMGQDHFGMLVKC
jgi:hypothetical protein